MSTRSRIAILNEDGSVESVYCHSDGYVSGGVGEDLVTVFNSEESAREIISLGNLSSLYQNLAPIENGVHLLLNTPVSAKDHSFDNRQRGCTVAYHRDRGWPLTIRRDKSLDDLRFDMWEEYGYIWMNEAWYVTDPDINSNKATVWRPVLNVIAEEQANMEKIE